MLNSLRFDPRKFLQRLLIGYAEEVEMDAPGRVLISPALRSLPRWTSA